MNFTIQYAAAPNYARIYFDKLFFKKGKGEKRLQSVVVLNTPDDLERLRVSHDEIEINDHLDFERLFFFLQALLRIPGLVTVVVNDNWISLARRTDVQWENIIPKVESALQEL